MTSFVAMTTTVTVSYDEPELPFEADLCDDDWVFNMCWQLHAFRNVPTFEWSEADPVQAEAEGTSRSARPIGEFMESVAVDLEVDPLTSMNSDLVTPVWSSFMPTSEQLNLGVGLCPDSEALLSLDRKAFASPASHLNVGFNASTSSEGKLGQTRAQGMRRELSPAHPWHKTGAFRSRRSVRGELARIG